MCAQCHATSHVANTFGYWDHNNQCVCVLRWLCVIRGWLALLIEYSIFHSCYLKGSKT
jgi:hypothetical protein